MIVFLLTVLGVFLVAVCFCVGLLLGNFFGRQRQRRCACAEARRVERLIENRKKAEKQARNYSPETVDPNRLPVIDVEMTEKSRG